MDIAAMSMSLSNAKLSQDVGLAMVKKTMDVQEMAAANLVQMLNSAAPKTNIIDVRA